MQIGYARVSTIDQDTALQLSALRAAGVIKIIEETRSGAESRPQLDRLLARLQPGDVLYVYKVDRLARSLADLLRVLQAVTDAGATFKSLTEPLETTTPAGRMLVQLLGAFAEFERAIIRERCEAGRRAARDRGVQFGRRPVVAETAVRDLAARGLYIKQAAAEVGVSDQSMRRAAKRFGLKFATDWRVKPDRA